MIKDKKRKVKPILAKKLPRLRREVNSEQLTKFLNISNIKIPHKGVTNISGQSFTSWYTFERWINDNYDVGYMLPLFTKTVNGNIQITFVQNSNKIGYAVLDRKDMLKHLGANVRITRDKLKEAKVEMYSELRHINKELLKS